MALVFKSNKIATNIISDFSGYKGALDYDFTLDINNDLYFRRNNGNREAVLLSDYITVSRGSSNGAVFDSNLNISYLPANTPRRSYLPSIKKFGVIIEESRYNFFDQSTFVGKIVTLPATTVNYFFCYAIGGSATVSSTEVDIISGNGTYKSPMVFTQKTGGTVTPFINISGNPTSVMVEQCTGHKSPSIVPLKSSALKSAESMTLSGLTSTGTLVLNIVEHPYKVSTADEYIPYLKIELDADNWIGVNRRISNNTLTIRLYKAGVEVLANQIAITSTNNIFALTWNNGVISYGINGKSYELNMTMDSNFYANSISILSSIYTWVKYSGNASLLNVVGYSRVLTLDELKQATVSW